ncbi:MAG: ATP-binding protein [Pseudomonadota bacterium]
MDRNGNTWSTLQGASPSEGKDAGSSGTRDDCHLADALRSLDLPLFVLDCDGTVEALNHQALALVGQPSEELLGRPFLGLIADGRLDGPGDCSELSLRASDGRTVPVLARVSHRPQRNGTPAGMTVAAIDIAERKRREMILTQAHKLESVGQLAAGIAHEINTPVQFVSDSTLFLQSGWEDLSKLLAEHQRLFAALRSSGRMSSAEADDLAASENAADLEYLTAEIPKALERALVGLERVSTIVRALKEFAHPGDKERSLVDINKALSITLTVARHEYKYHAEVETDFADLPLVLCNGSDLCQVFLNLIVNAAHALADRWVGQDQKGQLRIRTTAEDGSVVIAIQDNGGGIPESVRHRIFEPFFTTKPVGKGTGQGLAIARAVVEQHQGRLSFESIPGEGTTFSIRLPIGDEEG